MPISKRSAAEPRLTMVPGKAAVSPGATTREPPPERSWRGDVTTVLVSVAAPKSEMSRRDQAVRWLTSRVPEAVPPGALTTTKMSCEPPGGSCAVLTICRSVPGV